MSDNAPCEVSTTAPILVVAVRASHLRWCPEPIFSDEYAIDMVPPFWRLVANNRLLNRLVVDVLLRTLKPTHTVIIVRARYAEDRLWKAVSAGVLQYVILGAGLDTFALRSRGGRAERLRIYEVDHPASSGDEAPRAGADRRRGAVEPQLGGGRLRDRPARRRDDRGNWCACESASRYPCVLAAQTAEPRRGRLRAPP